MSAFQNSEPFLATCWAVLSTVCLMTPGGMMMPFILLYQMLYYNKYNTNIRSKMDIDKKIPKTAIYQIFNVIFYTYCQQPRYGATKQLIFVSILFYHQIQTQHNIIIQQVNSSLLLTLPMQEAPTHPAIPLVVPQMDLTPIISASVQCLPSHLRSKYSTSISRYMQNMIPFELSRIAENQSLSSKTSALQRHKSDLQSKIRSLARFVRKNDTKMQNQSTKILDLQRTVSELDRANNDNLSVILALKMSKKELEEEVQQNVKVVLQGQDLKKQILKKYQKINDEYNMLLSNYMKDKNIIAEKLNFMNELEQKLFLKQKNIKDEQIYLKQQWEQLLKQKQKQKSRPKIFKKGSQQIMKKQVISQSKPVTKVYEKDELLSVPVKKIISHHKSEITGLSVSSAKSTFATCSTDRLLKIYDTNSFQVVSSVQAIQDNTFICVSMDATGDRVLAGGSDKSVQIYDTKTGNQLRKLMEHDLKVNTVDWCHEKQKLSSGSEDKHIKIWDVEKGQCINSIASGKQVRYLVCSRTHPMIYSGHSDGSFRVYSHNQPGPVSQIKGIIDYPITSIVTLDSNPAQFLLSSQEGSPIHLVDIKTNKSLHKFEAKDYFNKVGNVEVSTSEKYVIAGNCDGYVYYWNRDKKQFDKKISGHDYGITHLKFMDGPDRKLVTCDSQGNVILWT